MLLRMPLSYNHQIFYFAIKFEESFCSVLREQLLIDSFPLAYAVREVFYDNNAFENLILVEFLALFYHHRQEY